MTGSYSRPEDNTVPARNRLAEAQRVEEVEMVGPRDAKAEHGGSHRYMALGGKREPKGNPE